MKITAFNVIHTLVSRFLMVILFIVIVIPLSLCLFSRKKLLVDNKLFMFIQQFFYWGSLKCLLVPIHYKGLKNIPEQPCIIVANHQSSMDIPLVGCALKNRPHVWLTWADLAKAPLLQFIVPRVSVLVDMASPMKRLRTVIQSINIVKKHDWDLIIFPEGGRFTDGSVHPFFGGFALIAKKVDRPVVPIKIIGANKVYPPETFWAFYHPITVIIGQPMVMLPDETEEAFKARVYNWFVNDAKEH
jgi:1-acyl-sn-glycerol-3-phosphate acyltransferase